MDHSEIALTSFMYATAIAVLVIAASVVFATYHWINGVVCP